ncbi:MAG: nitrous oxide reductase accessory protein NosL [Ignavibacteriales bacterium]|nr:nitrous oxide reductase accessory protein NosL [Ignavibacteriales bacterium]
MKNYLRVTIVFCSIVVSIFILSCYKAPVEISYNIDVCAECGMLISDQHFGAEIVLRNGKYLKYDTIDCLIKTVLDKDVKVKQINSRWVVDYSRPSNFIYLPNAIFYKGDKIKSPSGNNIIAVEEKEVAERIQSKHGGKILSFRDVIDFIKKNQLAASL